MRSEDAVPAAFAGNVTLNAISGMRPEEFVQAPVRTSRTPNAAEIAANKRRWEK